MLCLYMSADGKNGMVHGKCPNRADSSALNDRSKSLVLVNHFRTIPIHQATCKDNSKHLINMLSTCYAAAGNRWANFVAVDYYKVKSSTLFYCRLADILYILTSNVI